jgi:CHASE2 domain-containing sensor protein
MQRIRYLLTHPLIQIISFCILLVGSPNFGGPYGLFVYHSALKGYVYGVTGIPVIVITLVSLAVKGKIRVQMQLAGIAWMLLSLGIFFFSPHHFINASTFDDIVPLSTLLLLITTVLVIEKSWKFYHLKS